MKVLFCAYDIPGLIASGPNAWLQRLIPDLRETYNFEVSVLFIHKDSSEDCPSITFFKKNNLPIHLISRSEIPYIEDQVKLILKLIEQKDYKILVANLVIPAFYASKYLKPFGIPVVGVLHSRDSFYESVVEKFINGSSKNQVGHFVAVSKYIESRARNKGIKEVSVSTIPCGTPTNTSQKSKNLSNSLKVVYAGRLVNEAKQIIKLTSAFIEASKQDSRFKFIIYGSGEERDSVIEILKNSNTNKVVYGGAVAPAEIINKLNENHVFTLMSDYEGMPIALMEAMASGLVPVCLNEESGINEIIENGVNGLIVKNRGRDYQEKLSFLINNPDDYKRMSSAAIATIHEKYSSEVTHKQWADLLINILPLETRPIKIPKKIRLDDTPLFYGDKRRPSYMSTFKKEWSSKFLELRMFLRPRARIRSMFKLDK